MRLIRLYWLLTLDRVDYSFQIVRIQCSWITFIYFASPFESTFFANLFAAFTFQISLTTSINCFATLFPFVWLWKKYGNLNIFYQKKTQFIKELAPKKSWWPLYNRFIWCISLHCEEEVPNSWCWQILTPNIWAIRPLLTRSKWNMDEICGLICHSSCVDMPQHFFWKLLHGCVGTPCHFYNWICNFDQNVSFLWGKFIS